MENKTTLKQSVDFSELQFDDKWRKIGNFQRRIKKWSQEESSHPKLIEGYGDWIFFEEFTKLYWKCSCFEAIGPHFGGLVNISSQTLNFIDRPTSRIEVRKNIYGSIQAKIKVTDEFESLSPHFGDISPLDPPSTDYGDLSILNFTNSMDLK